jgi:hypothetical protein
MIDRPDPDADLIAELRSVLGRVDPVPPDVTEFAQTALGWRRLDADLAELLADSALETESAALTRSEGGGGRWLTFRAADLAIDVEVVTGGAGRTLLGQLAPPPAAATVEVQAADGTVFASAEADSLGRFRLTLERTGRMRLRVLRRDPPGAPVETSWLTL